MKQPNSTLNTAGQSTRVMAQERKSNRLRLGLTGFLCLGAILFVNWTNMHALKLSVAAVCMVALVAVDRFFCPRMDWQKKREGHASREPKGKRQWGQFWTGCRTSEWCSTMCRGLMATLTILFSEMTALTTPEKQN